MSLPRLVGKAPAWMALITALGLVAGCGGKSVDSTSSSLPTTSTTATSATSTTTSTCSASQLRLGLFPQQGLPGEVAAMRSQIFEAAMSCDYGALESLALAGSGDFTFTFGGGEGGPAAYWRLAEEEGEGLLAELVTILNMPYGNTEGMFVWPFAHALDFHNLTPDQEALLAQYFHPDDIRDWKEFGGYLGYRVGITESGDWMFFVAGD